MRIGLQVPSFTYPGAPASIAPTLKDIAQTVDEGGFSSLWVMDHFFQIRGVGAPEEPMLEGYSALNYFAALTKNVRLGTLVTGVIYRYPGVLAKTVTTLDVLSGGRAYCGIGAAWNDQESAALGVPFPTLKDRFEMLEETLQIIHQMWSGEAKPFNGKHYQLGQTLNSPQVLSQPRPPILIGGMGEQKTIRLIAQYGDACNFFARAGNDVLRQKLDVLKAQCDANGRAYEDIEKTSLDTVRIAPDGMTADDVIKTCRELADLGFQHAIFNMPNVYEITPLEVFARDIIPVVSAF